MPTFALIASLIGAALVLAWRVRETTRPITAPKIVIPPLMMSTGLAMFAYPPARIPWSWAACAFGAGALLLSYPLMKTSKLIREGDDVRLKRGKAFLWILLGLVAIRLAARGVIGRYVDVVQTGSIFFLLAFGMIVRWRVAMFIEYRALHAQVAEPAPLTR